MRIFALGRVVLQASAAAALFAGCGGLQPPAAASGVMPEADRGVHRDASSYKVVYKFTGGSDGDGLAAPLIDVNGTLYGTTEYGGSSGCFKRRGCGTVFSLTPDGSEKVLYSFSGGADGAHPAAALIDVNGTLYGTTLYGGDAGCKKLGCGTMFRVTTSGQERVLHRFTGYPDGAFPRASLLDVHGTLYGTTERGGTGQCQVMRRTWGCGSVYAITTGGDETVLHSFGDSPDGSDPQAPLIDVNGTLYGTTVLGGSSKSCKEYGGCGTVYSLTTSGSEKVVYSFNPIPDGQFPSTPLVAVNGVLYGTTASGGDCCTSGRYDTYCGVVYSVTTGGAETVLYTFPRRGHDGAAPYGSLINVHDTLYGTTEFGGDVNDGTVFSVTTGGKESVLYKFDGKSGAAYPDASLVDVNGTLYGVTRYGGGAVFALTL